MFLMSHYIPAERHSHESTQVKGQRYTTDLMETHRLKQKYFVCVRVCKPAVFPVNQHAGGGGSSLTSACRPTGFLRRVVPQHTLSPERKTFSAV